MEGCSFLGPNDPTEDVILRSWGIRIDHVTEDVAVRTLDSWVDANSISRVDFVKMDVEGSEIGVIEGGMKTFHKHRPKLIVELNKNTLSLYYNLKPSIFFMMLTRIYDYIYIIPDDPEIPCVHVDGFEQIEIVLERPGHWWVDLLCLSHPL
jgi:hypothetical protein